MKDLLYKSFKVAAGVNIIINGMALKHERSIASFLKLLLPTSILGGLTIFKNVNNNEDLENAAFCTMILGIAGNGIKNIWDIYSLVNYNQSESVQHNA